MTAFEYATGGIGTSRRHKCMQIAVICGEPGRIEVIPHFAYDGAAVALEGDQQRNMKKSPNGRPAIVDDTMTPAILNLNVVATVLPAASEGPQFPRSGPSGADKALRADRGGSQHPRQHYPSHASRSRDRAADATWNPRHPSLML
jgi:hypothetical protein